MPSTKTLVQSPTIGAVDNNDLLWIWDSSASELNKISRTNLLTTTDDFNTSYARLDGRLGGQTLIGGTAANEDLTLEGTSNATRTTSYVILQPNGGNVGIGIINPSQKLDIRSSELFLTVSVGGSVQTDYSLLTMRTNSGEGQFLKAGTGFSGWGGATALSILNTGGPVAFFSNADINNCLFLDNSGNFGIGTTSPALRLHVAGTILIDGDEGGIANTIGLTDGFDLATRSTGVGTIKFNDATNRDSSGFVKIYIGVTAYYIPVFAAI